MASAGHLLFCSTRCCFKAPNPGPLASAPHFANTAAALSRALGPSFPHRAEESLGHKANEGGSFILASNHLVHRDINPRPGHRPRHPERERLGRARTILPLNNSCFSAHFRASASTEPPARHGTPRPGACNRVFLPCACSPHYPRPWDQSRASAGAVRLLGREM